MPGTGCSERRSRIDFGSKRLIAPEVWRRLGDTPNTVEPFFGSGVFLLARPGWDAAAGGWRDDMTRVETVNDIDGLLCNAWRSIQADPEETARYADNPVSECDLMARHIWLVNRTDSLGERLMADPDFYDAKAAGWWVWGICCWIGSGWCSGEGPWTAVYGQLVHLGDAGQGVNRKLVHLGDGGQGVNRKRPLITNDGVGVTRNSGGIYEWFAALSARLRRVRVVCGDWRRVLGPTPTTKQGLTAVFLDPPYSEGRAANLYAKDSLTVAEDVRRWAIEHGDDPLMRIAVAGYSMPGYEFPDTWECVPWKAHGGYGSQGEGRGRENAHKERLFFSPNCIRPGGPAQLGMGL